MNIEELLNKIKLLEEENNNLKIKLSNYTAPSRSKKYYENHKEEIKERVKSYKEQSGYKYVITAEKKKEYARTAYLNKKEKIKNEKLINNNII